MVETIPPALLLVCIVIFAVLTVWNLRKYLKFRTSPIPTLISALVFLWAVLIHLNEKCYAYPVILTAGLIAVISLPSAWKDWVKILRYENINPENEIKPRDYFGWSLFIKLGYRFGVKMAAFLYALNCSTIFAICYCTFGTLLSMKFSCVVALAVAIIIFPVNYYLARKTIDALISERKIDTMGE
jgi:hypothetical protein